jgi:predicted secreted protein
MMNQQARGIWTGILFVAICLSLASCAGNTRSSSGLREGDISLGTVDNGKVVRARVGQLLLVRLPENPSSGRTWQLVRQTDQLVVMPDGERLERDRKTMAENSLVQTQELRFKATGPGETILSMAYVRPGTGLNASDDRWMVQIIVE